MSTEKIPFWHFFHDIEKELSYERWISKYKILLQAFEQNIIGYDDEWLGFKTFCRSLYLQNNADRSRFDVLLSKAIEKEKEFMVEYVRRNNKTKAKKQADKIQPGAATGSNVVTNDKENDVNYKARELSRSNRSDTIEEPGDGTSSRTYYYQPHAPGIMKANEINPETPQDLLQSQSAFLMTDEYFSVTRRQMVKGWQFLRYKESSGSTGEIDITGTVNRIAKEGLFTTPSFKLGLRNREDALILFADIMGSMTPFHELTERLIATAKSEGGHPKAPVYYFKNYPSGYVYGKSNFTNPVKISEALIRANRNSTIAVIISDGGAAKANTDETRMKTRATITEAFLKTLARTCAHVIWLNPMPEHRWKNTAVERIPPKLCKLRPIMDEQDLSFQDMLRTILRHTKD